MPTKLIPKRIEDEYIQRLLDLILLLHGSNYRILEGILTANQSTLIFGEEDESPPQACRSNVKVVVEKNHWKFETEIL